MLLWESWWRKVKLTSSPITSKKIKIGFLKTMLAQKKFRFSSTIASMLLIKKIKSSVFSWRLKRMKTRIPVLLLSSVKKSHAWPKETSSKLPTSKLAYCAARLPLIQLPLSPHVPLIKKELTKMFFVCFIFQYLTGGSLFEFFGK